MLTDATIRKQPTPESRKEIPDGKIPGLYLVIQPVSGARSWALRYKFGGKNRKLVLGRYPEIGLAAARKIAQDKRADISAVRDPAAEKAMKLAEAKAQARAAAVEASGADRVKTIADEFMKRRVEGVVGNSWARETARVLRVEIEPVIGDKRIGDVRRADIQALLDGIVDRGSPIMANRVHAVLRTFFGWLAERDYVAANPLDKIKAPAVERARERVLDDAELRAAWAAFDQDGYPYGPIAKLLLLTAARRGEISEAPWAEVDLAAKTWRLPGSRTKNGIPHEIPLSRAALEILESLPRHGGFVFAQSPDGPAPSDWTNVRKRFQRVASEIKGGDPIPAWTIHDLRRTAASGMAALGVPPHVVEAVLNHKSGTIKGVAAVYNRYTYAAEKRDALDRWAAHVAKIVKDGERENNG